MAHGVGDRKHGVVAAHVQVAVAGILERAPGCAVSEVPGVGVRRNAPSGAAREDHVERSDTTGEVRGGRRDDGPVDGDLYGLRHGVSAGVFHREPHLVLIGNRECVLDGDLGSIIATVRKVPGVGVRRSAA